MTRGTARLWQDEESWGVLDSDQTPGGCWAHFSALEMDGFHTLRRGQAVDFDWEAVPDQDGFKFLATRVRPL